MKIVNLVSFRAPRAVRVSLAFALFCAALPIVSGTESFAQNVKSRPVSSGPNEELTHQYASLIESLSRISEIYYYEGKLGEARQTLENGAQLLKGKDISPKDAAQFQIQRGKIHYYKNSLSGSDYKESIAFLLNPKKTVEALDDEYLKAKITDFVGRALYSQAFIDGDFETPLKYFREALVLRQKIGDRPGITESLFHHGLVYENKKNSTKEDKEKAFEYYRQSLDLAEKDGYKLEAAYLYRHLAYIYQAKGDPAKALDYYRKALKLAEDSKNTEGAKNAADRIAKVSKANGN